MKKEYIKPISGMHSFRMKSNMLAGSGFGLNDGDNVGNQTPTDDNDDNFFSKGSSMWEYMEMEEE